MEGVTPDTPPPQIRVAGLLVGLQGVAAVAFAILVGIQDSTLPLGSVLGEVGYFAVIGIALVFIGAALFTGRRGARTPAIVTQLLLLPVVYSLIGPVATTPARHRGGHLRRGDVPAPHQRAVSGVVDGAVLPRAVSAAPSRRKVVHSSMGAAPSVR